MTEVYIVQNLMAMDLCEYLKTYRLGNEHKGFFLYQMLGRSLGGNIEHHRSRTRRSSRINSECTTNSDQFVELVLQSSSFELN